LVQPTSSGSNAKAGMAMGAPSGAGVGIGGAGLGAAGAGSAPGPEPRWKHTATTIDETRLLVFGGYKSSSQRCVHVWMNLFLIIVCLSLTYLPMHHTIPQAERRVDPRHGQGQVVAAPARFVRDDQTRILPKLHRSFIHYFYHQQRTPRWTRRGTPSTAAAGPTSPARG
jgi:hypothetical protein